MKMVDVISIVICVFHLVSTIAIFCLFRYAIVRHKTCGRGGINTGFASAALIMVDAGMCLHCTFSLTDELLFLTSKYYYSLVIKNVVVTISWNTLYLFILCWTSAICLVVIKNAISMTEPKKTNNKHNFGFYNVTFRRCLVFIITIEICYSTSAIAIYTLSNKEIVNDQNTASLGKEIEIRFYINLVFYVLSGICIFLNITSLLVFVEFMHKSYRRGDKDFNVWTKLPRQLQSSIKCCCIMSFMWLIRLVSWIMDVLIDEQAHKEEHRYPPNLLLSHSLQVIYSLQGLVLSCVVFFYHSNHGPSKFILSKSRSQARTSICDRT